jgi:hypothetical protein
MVTVVGLLEVDSYAPDAALVAVTMHVPAVVVSRDDPVIEQPVAVPSVAAYVTAPVPDPPDVSSVRGVPTVPVKVERESVDCGTLVVGGGEATSNVCVVSELPK